MNTFTRVAMATITMVGMASAQPKTDSKTAPGAGSGSAAAGAKVDAKAGAGAVKVDAKAGAGATGGDMMAPKPATEIADMVKHMNASSRCTGSVYDMKGQPIAMKATMKATTELGGFWIHESMTGTAGKMTYKMEAYTTYDATAKKWRRVSVDSYGMQMTGTSDGMKDMKMDFNSDTISPMGASMFKDHVDASDAKAGVKVAGEMSMDKGKTWNKVYEMTCKK